MFLCDYFGSVNRMNDYEQGLEPVDRKLIFRVKIGV